jgi:hypothetical protein
LLDFFLLLQLAAPRVPCSRSNRGLHTGQSRLWRRRHLSRSASNPPQSMHSAARTCKCMQSEPKPLHTPVYILYRQPVPPLQQAIWFRYEQQKKPAYNATHIRALFLPNRQTYVCCCWAAHGKTHTNTVTDSTVKHGWCCCAAVLPGSSHAPTPHQHPSVRHTCVSKGQRHCPLVPICMCNKHLVRNLCMQTQ